MNQISIQKFFINEEYIQNELEIKHDKYYIYGFKLYGGIIDEQTLMLKDKSSQR